MMATNDRTGADVIPAGLRQAGQAGDLADQQAEVHQVLRQAEDLARVLRVVSNGHLTLAAVDRWGDISPAAVPGTVSWAEAHRGAGRMLGRAADTDADTAIVRAALNGEASWYEARDAVARLLAARPAELAAEIDRGGLTATEASVLGALTRLNGGSPGIRDLAEAADVEPEAVSAALIALGRAGYARTADPIGYELTDAGARRARRQP